jgi:AmiR/NasT family two-component response regulator
MPAETALRALVLADAPVEAELLAALRALGHAPLTPVSRHTLVHAMHADDAPQLLVCHVAQPDDALFDALAQAPAACARVVFTADASDAALERALDAGVHAWVVNGYAAQRLDAVLRLARARARRDAAARAELERSREQLDERKWIERAKGVLMSARRIGEDEAFKLLRGASMHAQLRVAEMSRAVVDAAQRADAINRAGQLRMLSQRIVKLLALRAARIDVRSTAARLAQSRERVQAALAHLHGVGAALNAAAELAQVDAAWRSLEPALDTPAARTDLAAADAAAAALLEAAERLVAAIEAGSGVRSVRIVNLCGRQRMRAQRIVKLALLASVLPAAHAGTPAIEHEIAEFEQALDELERAPLTSPEVRAGLLAAREEWLRLLRGLREAGQTQGRTAMAHSSERLLDHFEALTTAYETSLQVIMNG